MKNHDLAVKSGRRFRAFAQGNNTMWSKAFVACILLASVASVSPAKNANDVVADVARTIGAGNLQTLQYSATGSYFTFGQNYGVKDPWPRFALKSYTRSIDYEHGASEEKFDWTQAEDGERGGGLLPLKGAVRSDIFVSGDYAWGSALFELVTFGAAHAVDERQMQIVMTPAGWVRAAMAASPTAESRTVHGKKLTLVSFVWKGKYKVNGYVDGQNLLEKVETWLPQAILGDMLVETSFSDYHDYAGVKFPSRIVQKQGGFPVLDLTVTDVQPNAPVNIVVPDAARKGPAPLRVQSQKLADGEWYIRAGFSSMAVEFKDYVVILDPITDEARSLAVIAEVNKLVPNKPIKYVFNTHHHLDHAGGLRPFVDRGATVITAEMNKPYYEKIFKLPHTLDPDELARNPKPATFIKVKSKYVLSDGSRSIEFYAIPGNSHSPDMLIAYMPDGKIVFEGDMYNPGLAPPRPDAPPPAAVQLIGDKEFLRDALKQRNLDVEEFAPVHGSGPVPFANLQKEIDIEHELLRKMESVQP